MSSTLPIQLRSKTMWAIQLANSDSNKWINEKLWSKLEFDCGVKLSSKSTLIDIAAEVARNYLSYDLKRVKEFADVIYKYNKLEAGDFVLGVSGDRTVKKAGFVTHKEYLPDSTKVIVDLEWSEQIEEIEISKAIFKSEIQKLSVKDLAVIKLPVVIDEVRTFSGDHYEKYAANDPEIKLLFNKRNPELEKEDIGGEVDIFFGTNRDNKTKNLDEFYGDELSELKYGWCKVTIPRGHIQGEIERPRNFYVFEMPENSNRHITIKSVTKKSQDEFYKQFSAINETNTEKSALIFIHGYNTSFSEAARRTAQIAWDIPFNGLAGFFSWPSEAKTLSYLADSEKATASISFFELFITQIISNTGIERLHIIAHSMGSQVLLGTLSNLENRNTLGQKIKIINQIILAAPDIDQSVFRNNILPFFPKFGHQRTLYVSDRDRALRLSESIRKGLPRLGDAGASLFVSNGIDTIDASNVNSFGNEHSYIFETKELLTDLFYLLSHGFNPQTRRLRAKKKDNLFYWLFPK